jgi:hypothetical protein
VAGRVWLCGHQQIYRLEIPRAYRSGGGEAGTVLSVAPLVVACGEGALEIITGQSANGVYMQGTQLAPAMGLVPGALLSSRPFVAVKRRTRVLILGVNGFIGNHLTERLLQDDNYEIYGLDIGSDAISRFLDCPRFTLWKATSAFTPNGSNTTLRNVMSYCRWWPLRPQSSTPVTRCACSSWTSKRT